MTDGYLLGRVWAEQRRANENAQIAREWQAYAKQLEARLAEAQRELELLRHEQAIVKRERSNIVDQAKQHQLRAAVLDALQNKLASELEKANPGHFLVSAERRATIVDGSILRHLQPKMQP